MSAQVMESWLATRKNAMVNRICVKPLEHKIMKGIPLSSQKGQAEAFFLIDDHGNLWILKKFHKNRVLEVSYLGKIAGLLPPAETFLCGTKRQLLRTGSLWKTFGAYYSADLDKWMDGTLLMPCVPGMDWAATADELRDGKMTLDRSQRINLCINLIQAIEQLEQRGCAHRDLSCGNVFIDDATLRIYIIDFDSLYHASLKIPRVTTCGTDGYAAHHAWQNGKADPSLTWCQYADRYALALLVAEFLLIKPGVGATGEGGIFRQHELCNQGGPGINAILGELKAGYPSVAAMLEATIHSHTSADCPSPSDWLKGLPSTSTPVQAIALASQRSAKKSHHLFRWLFGKQREAAPIWPAPSLDDVRPPNIKLPKQNLIPPISVALPPDPWAQ